MQAVLHPQGDVSEYLADLLRQCCDRLSLPSDTLRTSALPIDPALRAQDRILAILDALGATRYVNLQGGAKLYDPAAFAARGIELTILQDWRGSQRSIAERLLTEPAAGIARDIHDQT